jgi:hypothetical protein
MLLETHEERIGGKEGSYLGTIGRKGEITKISQAEALVQEMREPVRRIFLTDQGRLLAAWIMGPEGTPLFLGRSGNYIGRWSTPCFYEGFTSVMGLPIKDQSKRLSQGLLAATGVFSHNSTTALVAVVDSDGVVAAWERRISGPHMVAQSPRPLPAPIGSL